MCPYLNILTNFLDKDVFTIHSVTNSKHVIENNIT